MGCIHTADLSAQTLPWQAAATWEECISKEFVSQADKELAQGRTPMAFMQFKIWDAKQRGKLQRDFIDFVLVPLWEPYVQLVPPLHSSYDRLLDNRRRYNRRSEIGYDEDQ